MKKKWLIRIAVMLVVFAAALVVAVPAMAMWSWCDCDPVLNISGHTVTIDAGLQGDPTQIRGDIDFTVTVPKGTQIKVVYCESNADVDINYSNSGACNSNVPCSSAAVSPSCRSVSRGTAVDVSVDINTKTVFNTRLIVTLDGKQVAQDTGTTRGDLDCSFTIQ